MSTHSLFPGSDSDISSFSTSSTTAGIDKRRYNWRTSISMSRLVENSLKRLSRSEWIGKRTTRIEQHTVASQVVKEHGVPGLHRPVGEQHIDLMRGIKVKCTRIDDGSKDVFPIGPDESIRRVEDG